MRFRYLSFDQAVKTEAKSAHMHSFASAFTGDINKVWM